MTDAQQLIAITLLFMGIATPPILTKIICDELTNKKNKNIHYTLILFFLIGVVGSIITLGGTRAPSTFFMGLVISSLAFKMALD